MSKFEKLINVVKAPTIELDDVDLNIILDHDVQIDAAVQALIEYFGEDDEHQAVRVVHSGLDIGVLRRQDLYTFMEPSFKVIGSGDHAILPGQGTFEIIELCCPVSGCLKRFRIILFDELSPPNCPEHPDKFMEVCK